MLRPALHAPLALLGLLVTACGDPNQDDAVDDATDATDTSEAEDTEAEEGETETDEMDTAESDCVPSSWYPDADGDGFGAEAGEVEDCEPPAGYVEVGGDCDDANPDVNPDARDVFDGVDNDCNEEIDDLPHWGYSDEDGHIPPDEWAQWWPACGGEAQSPVDVVEGGLVDGGILPLELGYADTSVQVTNNGHTLQWTLDAGSLISWDGQIYALEQFHIHAASERTFMGEHLPLEIHMVHRDDQATADKADDDYLVIGVPVVAGAEDPLLYTLGWDDLPTEEDESVFLAQTFNPAQLLSPDWIADPVTLVYPGSFTTPPCTEGVQWLILGRPLEFSPAQIEAFTSIYDDNFRPTQPLGEREIAVGLVPL